MTFEGEDTYVVTCKNEDYAGVDEEIWFIRCAPILL